MHMVYYQIACLGYFPPNDVQKSMDRLAVNLSNTMTFYVLATAYMK